MAVTIQDVAKAARVSVPVVSTVLNGSKGNTRVSEATRKRVMETAKRLKYRPMFASRSLARRRSDTLGVFVPPGQWRGIGFDYEGSILRGVEAACREKGFDVLAINLQGSHGAEHCAHKFAEGRIDGLLLLHVVDKADWVSELCEKHPNVATVNYHGACRNLDIVNFDNEAAAQMAVQHLVKLGHRRIGYAGTMTFGEAGPGAVERCDGYLRTLSELGMPSRLEWILETPNAAFTKAAKALPYDRRFGFATERVLALREKEGPTAWVGYNDFSMIELMRRLHRAGVKVPAELSLVGIDNSYLATLLEPALTSVSQPLYEMGMLAATRLIQRATQGFEKCPHMFQRCAPELQVRGSSGPFKSQRAVE